MYIFIKLVNHDMRFLFSKDDRQIAKREIQWLQNINRKFFMFNLD